MKVKHHISAGCYLLRKQKNNWQICLIYKKWSEANQGWMPPKGKVDPGESLNQTAIRETTEETGYTDIEIIKPLKVLNIEYPWDDGYLHKKAIHYYLAKLKSERREELKLSQGEIVTQLDCRWFDLSVAYEKLRFVDEREILEQVIDQVE